MESTIYLLICFVRVRVAALRNSLETLILDTHCGLRDSKLTRWRSGMHRNLIDAVLCRIVMGVVCISNLPRAIYCHHTVSHVCLLPVSIQDIARMVNGQASVACLGLPKLLAIMQHPLGRHLCSMVESSPVFPIRMLVG